MATVPSSGQLVVVGSSAGGIDALSTLVSSLPSSFPAPLVIAQHLDPQRPSHLQEILAHRSQLPVHTILDHEALQSGHIYVVPADRHVKIDDGHLSLHNDDVSRPKPSINLLFSTAAQVYGDGLIAVILTGSGSDGASGGLEVKRAGGTVVIQNPETASFPSMPRSLAPAIVDFVANIGDIGGLLYDLLMGVTTLTQPTETKAMQSFLQQVHERSGLDFTSYKPPPIQRRLQRRMVATGSSSIATYRRFLQNHPDEYARLISSFLIKVTEFFRDRDLFNSLREQVLPELIAAARLRGNELRLWSAGCATGEEAYSLALLVTELLGDELEQFTVRIFATDLDPDAIAFARRGIYPAAAVAAVPPEVIARFFHKLDGDYEIQKRVRSLVIFGQHDLGQRAPFPNIDLILCRNVLIYFSLELQKRVLHLFAYSLRDSGYLVLGKAETTSPLAEFFTAVHPALKIYQRHGERLLIPIGQFKDATPLQASAVRPTARGIPLLASREPPRTRGSMEKLGNLVFNLPIGVVVVDRHYDIQLINGVAHQLLEIHRAAIGEDLLHLAEEVPTKPLRALIDIAIQGEEPTPTTATLSIQTAIGDQRYLHIVGYPHQFEGQTGTIASVLLLITDATEQAQQQNHNHDQTPPPTSSVTPLGPFDRDEVVQQQHAENERLTTQVQRLLTLNRELRDANQALTTTNIELNQANEEYVVSTEEVQAAAEEVETLNEELQATNEELETLNEELQATVEELNATNDDLEARSTELQALAREREEQRRNSEDERAQLATILVSMGDAVLVVDPDGHPTLTNQSYVQLFGHATVSPPLADELGKPLPATTLPLQRAARGEVFTLTFTMIDADGGRRWFEANGQPIMRDEMLRGGVVVIRDITDRSLRRMQDEFLALASHELRTPLTSSQMALQMVRRKLPENDVLRRQTEIALRQVQHLNILVGDLMDVGRLQTGQMHLQFQPLALNDVVTQAVEAVQVTAPNHEIRVVAPSDTLFVSGDTIRLEQVMNNLLTNAVKYAPDSSHVDVCLRQVEGRAEVQVQDYGPGIAPDKIAGLFTRFYQVQQGNNREHGGLGLGLFITKELVTAHGGTVDVTSTVGQGTTFIVTLPLLNGGR